MKILKKILSVILCACLLSIQLVISNTAYAENDSANLSDLAIDGVTVNEFSPTTFEYNINVEFTTNEINVSATSEDPAAAISGDIGSLPVSTGLNSFIITVTAGDNISTKDYTLNITKAEEPVATASPTPTPTATPAQSEEPTPTSAPEEPTPTPESSPTPTPAPSIEPTATPTTTASPSPEPTVSPTATETAIARGIITSADGIVFDTDTGTITGYTGTATNLVIPDTIAGVNVINIGDYAFQGCMIENITFNNLLQTLGEGAFYSCNNLISVDLGNKLSRIEYRTFYQCSSLASISLPSILEFIGESAFQGCVNLDIDLIIPDNVTNMLMSAFSGCSKIRSVSLSDNLITVRQNMFSGCTSLESITFGEKTAILDDYAFSNCTSLTDLVFPESITEIGNDVFRNCDSITHITVPDNIIRFGTGVFESSDKLESVQYDSGTKAIPNRTFKDCTNLTTVEISGNITVINEAFYNCTGLTNITLPEGLMEIGSRTFFSCTSLTSIHLPDSLLTISDYAFYSCNKLTTITLPKNVSSIGETIFQGCDSLESIYVNENNTKYKSVDGVIFDWEEKALIKYPSNKSGTSYTVPSDIISISLYGFESSHNLTDVTLTEDVLSIGSGAFYNCSNIVNINISDNTSSIGSNAFEDCSSLKEIKLPTSIEEISTYTFSGCTSLRKVIIYENVNKIFDNAFSNLSDELVIYGREDSYAETFADDNHITFIVITSDKIAALSNLTVDGITVPGFSSDVYNYNVIVEKDTSSVTIDASAWETDSIISRDVGAHTLSERVTTFNVKCESSDGNTIKEYVVTISKDYSNEIVLAESNAFNDIGFIPLDSIINSANNAAYITEDNGNRLYRINLSTGVISYIEFYNKAERLTINGDKLYLCLIINRSNTSSGSGSISVIDLSSFSVSTKFDINYDPYDIVVDDQGISYIGPGSGQHSSVTSYNASGDLLSTVGPVYYRSIWDYNDKYNKLYSIFPSLRPNRITSYEINNGIIMNYNDFSYHGDYAIGNYFKVSPDGNNIYCSSGNIFTCAQSSSSDMIYDGNIDEFSSICFDIENNALYTSYENILSIYNYSTRNLEKQVTMNDELIQVFCEFDKLIFLQKKDSGEYYIDFGTPSSFNNSDKLSDISIDSTTIEGFDSEIYSYDITVESTVDSVEIGATSTNINANITGDIGTQVLSIGLNAFTVTCTAEDEVTAQDYTLNITREALGTITTDDGIVFDKVTGTITGYTGTAADLVIPNQIEGIDVIAIGDNAFANCNNLINIDIPTTINNIAYITFTNYSSNLTIYSDYYSAAYYHAINNGINFIDRTVITTADDIMFDTETGIIVDYLGNATDLIIPETINGVNVTTIGNKAFYYSTFTTLTLPNNLTKICENAFERCESMISINIGSNVSVIEDYPFWYCENLENIYVDDANPNFIDYDGVLATTSGLLVHYPRGSSRTEYTVPIGINAIKDWAFRGCNLNTVIFNDDVISFGTHTFHGSLTIETVELGYNTGTIDIYAFANCTNLKTVICGQNTNTIKKDSFFGCASITNVTIPSKIVNIEDRSFYGYPSNLMLYGIAGSNTQAYATTNSISFIDVSSALSDIKLDGLSLDDFVHNKINYYIELDSTTESIALEAYSFSNTAVITGDLGILSLQQGINTFHIKCTAENGIDEQTYTIQVLREKEGKFAILFGMADYPGTDNDLNGPINDMISMKAVLEYSGYTVYRYNNYSGANMLSTIEAWTKKISSDSTLLFAYSGHGADGGYLVGADDSFISITALESKLSLHTGVKEVIIDACYSGDFISRDFNSTDSIRLGSPNAFNNYVVSVFSNTENSTNSGSRDLAQSGYYVMTACSGSQLSYEHVWQIDSSPFAMNNLVPYTGYTDAFALGYFNISFHDAFGLYDNPSYSTLWADENDDNTLTWNEIYQFAANKTGDEQQAQVYPIGSNHIMYTRNTGSVSLSDSSLSLYVGESEVLTATVSPSTALNKDVTWASSNPNVATVSSFGTVEAVSIGTTTITVTTDDGGYTDTCDVTVNSAFLYNESTGTITGYVGRDTNVIIPSNINGTIITSIGDNAFSLNTEITQVTIPDTVTLIGAYAFANCSALSTVSIPSSVVDIGEWAFVMCTSLTEIAVSDMNNHYVSENGILYSKDKTSLILYPSNMSATGYIIPKSTTRIEKAAFYNCLNLSSITLHDGINYIGASAFYNCQNLTNISLPKNIADIYSHTFYKCSSLNNLAIPSNIVTIGENAFYQCTQLTEVNVPRSVTTIGFGAFQECSNLVKITLLDSVTSIESNAFSNCNSGFEIHGIIGSYADNYAQNNSHAFVEINASNEILSTEYSVDQALSCLFLVKDNTSVNYFKNCFINSDEYIKVYTSENVEVTTGNIGTGMVVNLEIDGEIKDSLTICVLGDVNSDGIIDIIDYTYVKLHIFGVLILEDIYFTAGDITKDSSIDIIDYSYIKLDIFDIISIN